MTDKKLLKLNIGDGSYAPYGYVSVDRQRGGEAYPLRLDTGEAVVDESVEEIIASHVLEHFGFGQIRQVLREWVRVLKPGGRLRVAVPDLTYIAKAHLRGKPEPYLQYLFGGQTDADDFHKSGFDRFTLTGVLREAGLTRIRSWSIKGSCASMPCSLNLEGIKPGAVHANHPLPRIQAVISMPRLSFTTNMHCCLALGSLGISFRKGEGAYWDQCLERAITDMLVDLPDLEYVLTVDYDSCFWPQDVLTLCDLAHEHPEADAIAPVQVRRFDGRFMASLADQNGQPFPAGTEITKAHYEGDLVRAYNAHFGLTLLKAAKLRQLPHPWFLSVPSADGTWGDGRTDADVRFWKYWNEQGHSLYLAPRVPIGHAQLVVSWPSEQFGAVHQSCDDFWAQEEPVGVWT